jgi:purine-binding chemotaxis protein CheW
VEFVREIIPIGATAKIPGQPPVMEGFLDFRGAILPIVRLAALFDLPFTPSAWSPIVVSNIAGTEIGLLVDAVDDVLTIPAEELRRLAPNHSVNEYATAEFTAGDRKYLYLDTTRLLLAEEQARIRHLKAQVDRRVVSLERGINGGAT